MFSLEKTMILWQYQNESTPGCCWRFDSSFVEEIEQQAVNVIFMRLIFRIYTDVVETPTLTLDDVTSDIHVAKQSRRLCVDVCLITVYVDVSDV
jgi:hypothetical protein